MVHMGEGEKLELEQQGDVIAPFARRVAEAARLYSVRAPSAWLLDSVSSGSVARSDKHKAVELVDEESWPSDESDDFDEVPADDRQRPRPTLLLDFGRAACGAEVARCSQFCRLPLQLLPPPATARPDMRPACRFPSVASVPVARSEPETDGSRWLQRARDLDSAGLPLIALSAASPCQPCGFRSAVLCALAARQRPRKVLATPARRPPARLPTRREIVRPKTPPSPLPPPPPPHAACESAVAQELVLRAAAAVRRSGCPSKAQAQTPPQLQAVPSSR